ncbi:MAG: hypothetical protein P8Y74_12585 [Desulfobacterales bacterium]
MDRKAVQIAIALVIGITLSWLTMARAQVLCPRTNRPYTAVIDDMQREARVGEPFFIRVHLDPETPPPGYYVSTLVDVLQSPDGAKPEVVTGFLSDSDSQPLFATAHPDSDASFAFTVTARTAMTVLHVSKRSRNVLT